MKKPSQNAIYLSLLICICLISGTGCGSPGEEEQAVLETVVEVITSTNTPEPTEAPPEPTVPPPPKTLVEIHDNEMLQSLDIHLDQIGFNPEAKENLKVIMDVVGNNVWPGGPDVEGIPPAAAPFADIIYTALWTMDYPEDFIGIPVTGLYTCGYYNHEPPTWVTCPEELDPSEVSSWHVAAVGFNADIPPDHETHYGTIALAMNPDGTTEGSWTPTADAPWDHFQNTKLWLLNRTAPGHGWQTASYDSNWNEVQVDYFTVFYSNLAVFYVSTEDMESSDPTAKTTTDWFDPQDPMGSFSGDTLYGDPFRDPEGFGSLFSLTNTFTNATGAESTLPVGYSLCSYRGCRFDPLVNMDDFSRNAAACECIGCKNTPGCDCAMFTNNKPQSASVYDETPVFERWEFVAEADVEFPVESNKSYNCFCVQKAE